jgi:DMSO/TMAO reductase YedYZ molybdopterin-dependent catalytic subunit
MALFVVRHQHAAERCLARDPQMGAMLLSHLGRANVAQHGVKIHGEAVVRGEHTLYIIAEAKDEAGLRVFLELFQLAGSIEVFPASTCAGVVASGGCDGIIHPTDPATALDPEAACQDAIEAGLVVHRAHPLNCETAIPALVGGVIMPNARFYVRNHFQIPNLDPDEYRLSVRGLVERTLDLRLRDIRTFRERTMVLTLECAGNGRSQFDPPTDGEKWRFGAVSTAEWTGVPLTEVLDRAGIRSGAQDVVFRGADCGAVDGRAEAIHFERSLPLNEIRETDALLAFAMNGDVLPIQHGYPLRLIIPGWYAVASVKWLTEIEVVDKPFTGYYQRDKYWYEYQRGDETVREPIRLQRVRALITEPDSNAGISCGKLAIRGVAWSGAAPIAEVEVSVDGSWQQARLIGERNRHSWQWWELITHIEEPGPHTLRARATDLAGRAQPERADWNRLGYGNNSIHAVGIFTQGRATF